MIGAGQVAQQLKALATQGDNLSYIPTTLGKFSFAIHIYAMGYIYTSTHMYQKN